MLKMAPAAATGCTGTGAQIDAAYALWSVGKIPPPPPAPISIHALPSSDPGMTGALFIVNNTLKVSQGPAGTAIQVGATGPTGQAAVI